MGNLRFQHFNVACSSDLLHSMYWGNGLTSISFSAVEQGERFHSFITDGMNSLFYDASSK